MRVGGGTALRACEGSQNVARGQFLVMVGGRLEVAEKSEAGLLTLPASHHHHPVVGSRGDSRGMEPLLPNAAGPGIWEEQLG